MPDIVSDVPDPDLDFAKAFDDLAAMGETKKDEGNAFGAHLSDPPVTVLEETPPVEPPVPPVPPVPLGRNLRLPLRLWPSLKASRPSW